MKCPKCGSHKMIPIIYATPTEDLFVLERERTIILGGSTKAETDPKYYCKRCEEKRCFPPLRIKESSPAEDLRETVKEIHLDIDDFRNYLPSISLVKEKDHAKLSVTRKHGSPLNYSADIPLDQWTEFVNKLYCELYFNEWPEYGAGDPYVHWDDDGVDWSLTTVFPRRRKRMCRGIDDYYPPYWIKFVKAIDLFLKAAGAGIDKYRCITAESERKKKNKR